MDEKKVLMVGNLILNCEIVSEKRHPYVQSVIYLKVFLITAVAGLPLIVIA